MTQWIDVALNNEIMRCIPHQILPGKLDKIPFQHVSSKESPMEQ